MYYVIQKHHGNPKKHYLAYTVPRYISSANSQNIIFEFRNEEGVKRKWAPKEEIVLLTEDEPLFRSVLEKLESIKQTHLEKIDAAEAQLAQEINALLGAMQNEFETIKRKS